MRIISKSEILLEEKLYNLKDTLEKIEKTADKNVIEEIFGDNAWFAAVDSPMWENEAKEPNITPDILRAIYKYSDEYGERDHSASYERVLTTFDKYSKQNLDINTKILDFGSGPNPEFIDEHEFHFVEINNLARKKMNKRYGGASNVFIYENLSEVFEKNIKFDIVYSNDCLEHVRYINEHLYLLYLLCKDSGELFLGWPYGDTQGSHISTLYEDTIIDKKMLQFIED